MCAMHYARKQKHGTFDLPVQPPKPAKLLGPCRDCERQLYAKAKTRIPPADATEHAGHGLCGRCRRHRVKQGLSLTASLDLHLPLKVHGHADPDPGVRRTARELQQWLDNRRNRGIPTTGVNTDDRVS